MGGTFGVGLIVGPMANAMFDERARARELAEKLKNSEAKTAPDDHKLKVGRGARPLDCAWPPFAGDSIRRCKMMKHYKTQGSGASWPRPPRRDIQKSLDRVQEDQDRGAAQHPDGELSPSRALQRRAHPRQAARRSRAGRPDVRRHLRPDGRDRRVRPGARREVRNLLRPRIRGAILDELRSMDWVPRLVRSRAHKLDSASKQLEVELGRAPTNDEIAKRLKVSMARVREDGQGRQRRRPGLAVAQVVRDRQQQGRPRDRRAGRQARRRPGPRDPAQGPEGADHQGPLAAPSG